MLKNTEKRNKKRKVCRFQSIFPVLMYEDQGDFTSADSKKAEVIDISETGMGLFVDNPLSIGQKIFFSKQNNWQLPDSANVIWSLKQENGFRAGIHFT